MGPAQLPQPFKGNVLESHKARNGPFILLSPYTEVRVGHTGHEVQRSNEKSLNIKQGTNIGR